MDFIGNVKGKRCLIFEDMIDTGGTIVRAAELLMENGAVEVIGAATHPFLTRKAPTLLQNGVFSKVFCTDSLYVPKRKMFPKLELVSLAPMLAEVIRKSELGESIRFENW